MKVSDSLVNVPNELSQLGTNRPTNRVTDQLLELLEWIFATKNINKLFVVSGKSYSSD